MNDKNELIFPDPNIMAHLIKDLIDRGAVTKGADWYSFSFVFNVND